MLSHPSRTVRRTASATSSVSSCWAKFSSSTRKGTGCSATIGGFHSANTLSRELKLLEYQAKELLASLGIAIPPGRVAHTPDEAAAACAELGPVAVKAQVPVGGRGKAGGIKLASSPEEARTAAQQVIGMDIKGFKVPLVDCESALDIEREIYLGFTVDRDARANILMLSAQGAMDIEQVAEESPQSLAPPYPDPSRRPLDFDLEHLS